MSRMRLVLGTAFAVLAAAVPIARAETSVSVGVGGTRMVVDLSDAEDRTTVVTPADLAGPEQAVDVGPGTHLLIDFPDGTAGCTANYVWRSGGKQYLGAAGHCFLDPDKVATHGPGADSGADVKEIMVRACVTGCNFGGISGFFLEGTTVELGEVAYARQSGEGGDVGNDFGVVEIPAGVPVRYHMPVFDGPRQPDGDLQTGDVVCQYGNGVGVGEVFPTMGRAGVGLFEDPDAFFFESASSPGDSGSAVQTCVPTAEDGLAGDAAIGILTHLTTIGVAGTTVEQAVLLAKEAGLDLELVLDGGSTGEVSGDDGTDGGGKGKGNGGGPPQGKGPKA
jgi:hypothetical protein